MWRFALSTAANCLNFRERNQCSETQMLYTCSLLMFASWSQFLKTYFRPHRMYRVHNYKWADFILFVENVRPIVKTVGLNQRADVRATCTAFSYSSLCTATAIHIVKATCIRSMISPIVLEPSVHWEFRKTRRRFVARRRVFTASMNSRRLGLHGDWHHAPW